MNMFYVHDKVKNNWLMVKKDKGSATWFVYYHYAGPVKERCSVLSPVEAAVQMSLGVLPSHFLSHVYGKLYLTNTDNMEIWVEK